MQTFLPSDDFTECAGMLDNKRLGKQRVETLQIMQTLLGYRLVSKRFDHWRIDRTGKTVAVEAPLPAAEWTVEPIVGRAWSNHSCVRMWRGYEGALLRYQDAVCAEWTHRGFRDSCAEKTRTLVQLVCGTNRLQLGPLPPWLGRADVHSSHRQVLLFKNPDHYAQFGWTEEPRYEYVWPVPAE